MRRMMGWGAALVCGLALGANELPNVGAWNDTDGTRINAHGGALVKDGIRWYWHGEYKTPGKDGNKAWVGVSCYSSTNLLDWTNEGIVFAVTTNPSPIQAGCILERPKVAKAPDGSGWVMFFHLEPKGMGYGGAQTGIAKAKSVTGPYELVWTGRPNVGLHPVNASENDPDEIPRPWGGKSPQWRKYLKSGQMSRDMTLYTDPADGRLYHIFASEDNSCLHLAEVQADGLGYTGKWARMTPGDWTEAPAVVKHGGWYYLIGSDCTGWRPNAARSYRAKSVWGPWERLDNPCRGVRKDEKGRSFGPELTWGGQSTGIFEVNGTAYAMFDVWRPDNAIDGRYVWLPITFTPSQTMAIDWQDAFRPSIPSPSCEIAARGVLVNGSICEQIERRSFDDGSAVRYVLPQGKRFVAAELTEWTLPEDARCWYEYQVNDYEGLYHSSRVGEIPVGAKLCLPVTAKLADCSYRMITEANVVDWTDTIVEYRGGGHFSAYYYADPRGFDQEGVRCSPWRVMVVAKDLATLARTDIVRRLCPDPSPSVCEAAAKFTRPGRAVWHWLPMGDPILAEQKTWIDHTKNLGYEYYLIDEGWRKWRDGARDQWACLKDCIAYGNSIGVKSFIWVHSKEIPDAESRRAYLRKVVDAGAVGIKIDFIPPASYKVMKWYEETLADTLAFGLMTDFHGAVKPSGRERTWPHEVAREAIRGHEWHVTRYRRVLPPEHDTILPFTRLVQGHADYTPMVFNPKELIHFTWARELAQGIIFSAPFFCTGDFPEFYEANPARDVIEALQPVYDETILLQGSEIGECVAVARRKGEAWYIAVENGGTDRDLVIDFSFLKNACRGRCFADQADRLDGYVVTEKNFTPGERLSLHVRAGGGWVGYLK